MTNVINFKAQEERDDEASIWVARLDRGLSDEETRQLQAWLSDQANRNALLETASLWDRMDALSQLADICPRPEPQPEARHRGFAYARYAVAASVTLAAMIGIWSINLPVSEPSPDTATVASSRAIYQTSVGEQSSITLSDGTRITLNTDSLLEVDYSERYRLLQLKRGELHVQVAHDESRPLRVLANDTVVQAVGTEFSVEITSDQQIELIVNDGRVLVGILDDGNVSGTGNAPSLLVESPVATVNAGQEIVLGGAEEAIRTLSPEEIEVRLSWRDGNLVFRGESLEEAVTEIGRYSMVEFVFLDETAKSVRIAGRFKAGDIDELLLALRENFDIAWERQGDDRILLSGR